MILDIVYLNLKIISSERINKNVVSSKYRIEIYSKREIQHINEYIFKNTRLL